MPAAMSSTWLSPDCDQAFASGVQLVEILSPALARPASGRILIDEQGRLWLSADDYPVWTGHAPDSPARRDDDTSWHAVATDQWQGDACQSRVALSAPQPRRHYQSDPFPPATILPAQRGGFLNVDLYAFASSDRSTGLNALTDLGISTQSGLWRTRQVSDASGLHRLDSQFRHDFTGQMTAIEIGDVISPTTSLSPGVRFGGLSWGSDFSQQPELPTWPLPSLSGDAALPSTAELYIDGQLRQRQQLAAGPYALDNLSGLNGAGDLQVVVRDALGRATRVSQPFYVSPRLLRSGLDEYHVDIGRLREGYAGSNDHYGEGFASGRWRRGLDDSQTLGGRVDALDGRQSAQLEWLRSAANLGLLQMALATSHDTDSGWGRRGTLGYEWLSVRGSIQAQYSAADSRFVELGRVTGALASSARLQTGWRIGNNSSMNIGWTHEIRRDRSDVILTAASWQQTLSAHRQLYLSLIHSPESGLASSIGLHEQLTPAQQLNMQLDHRTDLGAGFQLSWVWQPGSSPWSTRIGVDAGSHRDAAANANWLYQGERGQANIGIGHRGDLDSFQGSAAGALAWTGDNLFWTRRQQRGFVVVDAGTPDVMVYRNQQPAGRTDARGQALIADTLPYHTSEISLLADSIPLATQPGVMEARVKPPLGVAILKMAASDDQRSLSWQAQLSDGSSLPMGSRLRSDSGESAGLPSGLDGLLFLPARWQGKPVTAELPDGRRCRIDTLANPELQEVLTCHPLP